MGLLLSHSCCDLFCQVTIPKKIRAGHLAYHCLKDDCKDLKEILEMHRTATRKQCFISVSGNLPGMRGKDHPWIGRGKMRKSVLPGTPGTYTDQFL